MKNEVTWLLHFYSVKFLTEFKIFEMVEMWDKECRNLVLKVSNDLIDYANKQMNKVDKSVQNLNKKIKHLYKKFNKDTEIWKSRKLEIEELSKPNKWCNGMMQWDDAIDVNDARGSITSLLDHSKEYTKGKVEQLPHLVSNKENKSGPLEHDYIMKPVCLRPRRRKQNAE